VKESGDVIYLPHGFCRGMPIVLVQSAFEQHVIFLLSQPIHPTRLYRKSKLVVLGLVLS
jgi:hypothetical protein